MPARGSQCARLTKLYRLTVSSFLLSDTSLLRRAPPCATRWCRAGTERPACGTPRKADASQWATPAQPSSRRSASSWRTRS